MGRFKSKKSAAPATSDFTTFNLLGFLKKLNLTLLFLGCIALVITGIVLLSLYTNEYVTYLDLQSNFALWSGAESPGFSAFVTAYNNNAVLHNWPIASFANFAGGVAALVLGVVGISWFAIAWTKRKRAKNARKVVKSGE